MRRPKYEVCERCGRNKHKVAVRVKLQPSAVRPAGASIVVGYCPSCWVDGVADAEQEWRRPLYQKVDLDRIVYDLRKRKPEMR